MKKLLFIPLILLTILSCSEDDDTTFTGDASLDNRFTLISYFAFTPTVIDLEPGDIVWEFDVETELLTVVNSRIDDYPWMTPTGVYSFTTNGNMIDIETLGLFQYEVEGLSLTLNFQDDPQIADDELQIVLEEF